MAVAPPPSARLLRAVAAERADLDRRRARLASEADELRAALRRIEDGLAELDERRGLLDRLAPHAAEPTPPADPDLLRGPAIREAAIATLLAHGRDALHYRAWYELLERAGHGIAGKDPVAVFLTQISRSPAVRKGTRAGVYELDREAPTRLRRRLDALQREYAALEPTGEHARARRARLTTELGRVERALEEVSRQLEAP